MAEAAAIAVTAGATVVDLNFGCPAPTVNRHDGGATLLKYPHRVRDVVAAVRAAVPREIPVSAKLRLGWDDRDDIFHNADMAVEGGASWLTIHGRTRTEGYKPPADWSRIGIVRERAGIPVVANGDIFTLDAFRRCREETGCVHFMLGRGAIADPRLPRRVAAELGLVPPDPEPEAAIDWPMHLRRLIVHTERLEGAAGAKTLCRLKQWLKIAEVNGDFTAFDSVKRTTTIDELLVGLTGTPPCVLSAGGKERLR
jgi:tRNA-dihydrouridine synthase C